MLTSVGVPGAPSGKEPVIGTLTTVGQMSEPFEPVIGRPFYVSIWTDQTPFGGEQFYLCRSFDNGQNWTVVVDESITVIQVGSSKSYTSYEKGVLYAVELHWSSSGHGYNYRISQ